MARPLDEDDEETVLGALDILSGYSRPRSDKQKLADAITVLTPLITRDRPVAPSAPPAEDWSEQFECPDVDDHDCGPCPTCGGELHRFGDEPYCNNCALPHPGYFGAIRALLGGPDIVV